MIARHRCAAPRQSGFTLLELALTLAAVALFIGGILKGWQMVQSSRVRTMAATATSIQSAYLAFQDRFKISDDQWAELFRQRWFPFIGLSSDQLRAILHHASLKVPIDPLLDDMVEDAKAHCIRLREMVATHSALGDHKETLTKALQHFESGDYLSCATMLFPRIEGILRQRKDDALPGRATQTNLAAAAVADPDESRHSLSLLLPQKFRQFLDEIYFADFDPSNIEDVSRNTVSHGVAPEDKLSLKSAFMAVLILEQVVRLMPPATGGD